MMYKTFLLSIFSILNLSSFEAHSCAVDPEAYHKYSSGVLALPDELLIEIMGKLDGPAVLATAMSCQKFHRISQDKQILLPLIVNVMQGIRQMRGIPKEILYSIVNKDYHKCLAHCAQAYHQDDKANMTPESYEHLRHTFPPRTTKNEWIEKNIAMAYKVRAYSRFLRKNDFFIWGLDPLISLFKTTSLEEVDDIMHRSLPLAMLEKNYGVISRFSRMDPWKRRLIAESPIPSQKSNVSELLTSLSTLSTEEEINEVLNLVSRFCTDIQNGYLCGQVALALAKMGSVTLFL